MPWKEFEYSSAETVAEGGIILTARARIVTEAIVAFGLHIVVSGGENIHLVETHRRENSYKI